MTSDDLFASSAARRSVAVRVGALVCALAVVTIALSVASPSLADPTRLRTRVAALGPYAPLAFVALQTAQVVLAPVPGQVLAGVGGYLFGELAGFVYSMTGVVLGSAVAFVASRRFGRPYVERVVPPAKLVRWDAFFGRAGVAGLFGLFLLPTFPDDLLCFVAGLSEVRLRTFLGLVVAGRAPSFLFVAYAGTWVAGGRLLYASILLLGLGAASALVYRYRRRLIGRPGGEP